ncbi:MAG: hypothetical protein OEZ02_02425 [Anaerolineae bacterium]|nr:hypothetical protein [Anaerolineae bacterium]
MTSAVSAVQTDRQLSFERYQDYRRRFAVDGDLIRGALAACEPLALQALLVYGERHRWRGQLPVYALMTTPQTNGGWGHLMPLWFKPQERPLPFHTLDNWALFALVYAHSFGPSDEAGLLLSQVFTVEHLVRIVAGSNLLLPFLPSTQGQGYFFRHGMLPFLLAILWLDADTRQAWLRLHALGAQQFIERRGLAAGEAPVPALNALEHAIFAQLERNAVHDEQAVIEFLAAAPIADQAGTPSLLARYQDLFGAICLGVTALAQHYQAEKSLETWRDWFYQEISFPYRQPHYGQEAIENILNKSLADV